MASGGAGGAADAEDLGGSRPVDPPAGAVRTARFSRRPWPLPSSAQDVSLNSASVPASAAVTCSSRPGWLP
jgi:hypothetical protein